MAVNRAAPDEARPPPATAPGDLAEAVERRAEACPDTTAVAAGDTSLTYRQLDSAANQLAHHLRDLGVQPGGPVGICVTRSAGMAIGLLAILKAGGGCLPLDPGYPEQRLRFMLDDADPAVILTQGDLVGLLRKAGAPPGKIVDLAAERALLADRPTARPGRESSPERLAYVIYTSGSTGRPKGVLLPHRALVNHCLSAVALYGLSPADRVVQFCSPSFDVSIEELFPSWAAGATVVMRPPEAPILGRSWLRWLRAEEVTVLNLPTAYWHEWVRDLRALGEPLPPALRVVVVGGERALGSAYRSWLAAGGEHLRWFNAYGPTEAGVMATIYEAPRGGAALDGDPPIGRPLPGVNVRLLGTGGQPVAAGEIGEVHIGGAGLALGYLNDPELTAERFVADPFSERPGARLYRTGDLARLSPGGDLEFVGRRDRQVKVAGGFRVECGEVEEALRKHPGVAETAVVPDDSTTGPRRLVAYIVLSSATTVPDAALRRHLAALLPAYMVPAAFVRLRAFPLTPNGKIDHAALAASAASPRTLDRPPAPSRTATEQALAAIWSDVLGSEEIGVDDDLFELGGHSLQAAQIAARVEETFGSRIPLGALLAEPTAGAMARLLDAEGVRCDPGAPALVPLHRPHGTPIPLSLPQEQMWDLETRSGWIANQNITACYHFSGPVNHEALLAAVRLVADRHSSLRTSFGVHHGKPYQQVAATVPVELRTGDLTGLPPGQRAGELDRQLREQDLSRFDVGRLPLFRAGLFQLDAQHSVLALTFDHLICDGPSAYITLSEVEEAYQALARGAAPQLPPLKVGYDDFATWQRRWLSEDRLAAQLDYWRRVLGTMPLGPALPFDHIPGTPSRLLRSVPISVPATSYRALGEAGRASGGSMFVVCVAAVCAVLSRLGGGSDVVLSTTLSGRWRPDLEGVVGDFAGTGRIRVAVPGDPRFREVLARAREAVVGLFEHADVPFSWVRSAVLPQLAPGNSGAPQLTLLPVELQYFRAAHDRWAPGSSVVERPGPDKGPYELLVRGQLHPLSITLVDDGAEIWGDVCYKAGFYEEATIRLVARGLEHLLEAAAADPGLPLSRLSLMDGQGAGSGGGASKGSR